MSMTEGMSVEVETITPDIALEILGNHENNRNLRPRIVNAYASDMKAGRWALNGEAIKIDVKGSLIDGQHRLNAVICADIPVQMLVVRGLPTEMMLTVDSGVKRNTSDVLALTGQKYAAVCSAAARRMILWERGWFLTSSTSGSVTNTEIIQYVEQNPDLTRAAEVTVALERGLLKVIAPSIVCSAIYLTQRIDVEASRIFFQHLANEDAPVEHPTRLLRNKITMARLNGNRLIGDEVMALTIKAWNHYRRGQTPSRLMLNTRTGSLSNDSFPRPI